MVLCFFPHVSHFGFSSGQWKKLCPGFKQLKQHRFAFSCSTRSSTLMPRSLWHSWVACIVLQMLHFSLECSLGGDFWLAFARYDGFSVVTLFVDDYLFLPPDCLAPSGALRSRTANP